MRVLGITGSLRRGSYNHALLREAAERLPAGVEFAEFGRLAEIPPYDSSSPPSTTTRSPAPSRTPSTGPPARPGRAP